MSIPSEAAEAPFQVSKKFLTLAATVACHRDGSRWGRLYEALWRLTHAEPHLLDLASDATVAALRDMERSVRDDIHKMRAFVRFRQIQRENGPWYVAWFEPAHHIVAANAPFFVRRFASLHWSILTPEQCAHWDGVALSFTPGARLADAPREDAVEALWLKYYAHIFNPARVKTRALQHSMPKRYWKNLPEASQIPALLENAPRRVEAMLASSHMKTRSAESWEPATPPQTHSLTALHAAAAACRACPLYKDATQTVFGEGPASAKIVFLGEQPGDQEDLAGRPFVGPAGQLLDRALLEAGLQREQCYVTNAVKHFKWEPRGKRRLHATPNSRDIAACRPWMEAELSILRPKTLVCLGATAAKAIFGPSIRVLKNRGQFLASPYAEKTMITFHPSALLRAPTEEARRENYALFVKDLRSIA